MSKFVKIPLPELSEYKLNRRGILINSRGMEMKFGYSRPYILISIKGKTYSQHRLLALTFKPNPNNLPQVNHKNGNKRDNGLSNLEWSSKSHNRRHAFKTGLQKNKSGKEHWNSKLTQKDVDEIRRLRNVAGFKLRIIGEWFNISPITVHQIATLKRWNPVPIPKRKSYVFKPRKK